MLQRRFLKTREKKWAHRLAQALKEKGFTPNQVSLLSIVFALLAGGALLMVPPAFPNIGKIACLLTAALCIQLRLLCNLMDGMLAIEGKLSSKLGDIFNEVPDRISDCIILVAAGYAVTENYFGPALGWLAALLALFTAYLRVLGASLGTKAYFSGPMAKPQRMFALTMGCILAAIFVPLNLESKFISVALVIIVLGSGVTCFRRANLIVREVAAQ